MVFERMRKESGGKWERKPHTRHNTKELDSSGALLNLSIPARPLHVHYSKRLTPGGKLYNHKGERLKLLKACVNTNRNVFTERHALRCSERHHS